MDLCDLLNDAPSFERSLLELRASWEGLPEAHARAATKLRVFVLNWDPLGWLRGPFDARATATATATPSSWSSTSHCPTCWTPRTLPAYSAI